MIHVMTVELPGSAVQYVSHRTYGPQSSTSGRACSCSQLNIQNEANRLKKDMHITTSSHILSLADDYVYNLRKIGKAGDDSWIDSRRGEAFDRNLQVQLEKNQLVLYFESKNIGFISLSNTPQIKKLLDLVTFWNSHIGPTDLATIKIVELVRDWSQLVMKKQFQIKSITYNCAGLLGDLALRRELWTKLFGNDNDVSKNDIIVVGFQETDNLNRSVKANTSTLQRCQDLSKAYLYRTHTLVSSIQLLGLMTLLFVRTPLVPFVSNVTTDTSSTGFLRVWGNKGAVLTRFHLFRDDILGGGLEFSVVNCHLSAGEGITQLGRRRWELREIGNKFGISYLAPSHVDGDTLDEYEREFDDTDSISSISSDEEGIDTDVPIEPKTARSLSAESNDRWTLRRQSTKSFDEPFDKKESTNPNSTENPENEPADADEESETPKTISSRYTVLLGDMNYRILLSESEVQKKIKKQEWEGLLAHDSLSLEKHQYSVFSNFEEPVIRFAPTYKYEIGTANLKGRVPSYTDRIMFRTTCSTRILDYASIHDLKMSDHRPVALRNIVDVPNCINPDKYAEVISRALKIIDDAENNARPKFAVDHQQITLTGPPLSTQEFTVVIRNEGVRPVYWIAEDAQAAANIESPVNDDESTSSSGFQDSTASSTLTSQLGPKSHSRSNSQVSQGLETGNIIKARQALDTKQLSEAGDILITPGEGKITSFRPTMNLKLEAQVAVHPRDFIILVKTQSDPLRSSKPSIQNIEQAVQKYVFVRIIPTKSYLGLSMKSMPQIDDVPTFVRECVDYLWDKGVDDMFLSPAEPSIFQQVLQWLDNDQQLDRQVLDAIDPSSDNPAGVYAVSQVLLSFFRYLPDTIMGPNAKKKMAASKTNQACISYICKFINHMQVDDKSLDVWASVLYDHNDEKAGEMEKRAYLRSMLICY